LDSSEFWLLLVPPIAGGIIGYFTNDLAIKMLFRPYKPWYAFGRRVPFTPGLIPRNQPNLAQRVSQTIMGSLLTPEELQRLAGRLLQTERVKAAILWLLQLALEQVGRDKQDRTARILADILRDLFEESLPRLVRVLARREDFLEQQIDRIFDQVLLDFRLTETQARQLSDWLLQEALPPNVLRQAIVDVLTDRNIELIDDYSRRRSTGAYWIVANVIGMRNILTRLRAFCLDEKETANARLAEIVQSFQVRDRLQAWLQELSLQNLPVSTVRQLRATTRETIRDYLRERGATTLRGLSESFDWDNVALLLVRRLQASETMNASLEVVSEELALVLERYLERDLGNLVAQIVPILAIDETIVERVNATSPEQLEANIQGIVRRELRAIVNLGGALGFLVGILQATLIYLR
jgi:uncharacterized membrane protein YheB (UPF0754 family)